MLRPLTLLTILLSTLEYHRSVLLFPITLLQLFFLSTPEYCRSFLLLPLTQECSIYPSVSQVRSVAYCHSLTALLSIYSVPWVSEVLSLPSYHPLTSFSSVCPGCQRCFLLFPATLLLILLCTPSSLSHIILSCSLAALTCHLVLL